MTAQIKSIKRIKIICNKCKSEYIINIGNSIYQCPVCYEYFHIDKEDNPFLNIEKTFSSLKKVDNANISLLCEDD